MSERKGTISVKTADIFPIIKKWLYSEHDIFIRELITNATDAITKRHTLGRTLNQEIPDGRRLMCGINKSKKDHSNYRQRRGHDRRGSRKIYGPTWRSPERKSLSKKCRTPRPTLSANSDWAFIPASW